MRSSSCGWCRSVWQDELVLCLSSERRQADDVVVHRVLEGYILDVPEDSADTTGRRVLQPTGMYGGRPCGATQHLLAERPG